jgi:O-phosphoseryl-tRNA(Cys) synthetase
MLTTLYRKRIAALAIQLARDDPEVVQEVIARLRKAGEIDVDDLVYLDEIADRWIRIAEGNRLKGRR